MKFYLGTHMTNWLGIVDFPLFVSRRRLQDRKRLPAAVSPWSCDSGGFTELSMYGRWTIRFSNFVHEIRRYRDEIGKLDWAAPMDWMCEPFILAKTRGTVVGHQRRTIRNYLALIEAAPDVPWIPVLQGWTHGDYLRHVDDYLRHGIYLPSLPLVGVGSICRRQGETRTAMILADLAGCGLRLHGFGLKLKGIALAGEHLVSADSMAWSFDARRKPNQCGSATHKNCANCLEYAREWRDRIIRTTMREMPPTLFTNQSPSGVLQGLLS